MVVNPLAHQAKGLRRQPFRQAAGAFLLRDPAAQQGVDIRLGLTGFRLRHLTLFAPCLQGLLKARKLKRFNQVIHHAIVQRRL